MGAELVSLSANPTIAHKSGYFFETPCSLTKVLIRFKSEQKRTQFTFVSQLLEIKSESLDRAICELIPLPRPLFRYSLGGLRQWD